MQTESANLKVKPEFDHVVMIAGGVALLIIFAGFITSLDSGFNSIVSSALAIPLYFIGEGSFNLAVSRWPNLSAETAGSLL